MPACDQPQGPELAEAEELWEKMLDLCPPEHQELLRLNARDWRCLSWWRGPAFIREAFDAFSATWPATWRSLDKAVSPMATPESTTRMDLGRELQRPRPFPGDTGERAALVALLAEEMTRTWRHGERLGADIYLDRHPELKNQPAGVLDLVYEEICLRHEHREPIDRKELAERFPAWEAHIGMLIDCVYALETGTSFPAAGDTLGDFRIVSELGRGGQGRVFLAVQSSLGERPVVLKIAPRSSVKSICPSRVCSIPTSCRSCRWLTNPTATCAFCACLITAA